MTFNHYDIGSNPIDPTCLLIYIYIYPNSSKLLISYFVLTDILEILVIYI